MSAAPPFGVARGRVSPRAQPIDHHIVGYTIYVCARASDLGIVGDGGQFEIGLLEEVIRFGFAYAPSKESPEFDVSLQECLRQRPHTDLARKQRPVAATSSAAIPPTSHR